MAWTPHALSVLAFAAAGILAVVGAVGWRRERTRFRAFTALVFVVTCWAVVYGVQLGYTTAAEQLPWQRVTLATSAAVPGLLFVFAVQYADRRVYLTRPVAGVLVAEWAAFTALALTNPRHDLVWTAATLRPLGGSSVLDLVFGLGYFVHIVFAYSVVTVALWVLLSVYFRSSWVYRRQSALLIAGVVPPFSTHVLYTLKASPVAGLDLTPFAFTFTGIAFGLSLFHFDLLERTPVAHQRAVELTGDGLLVCDADGRVVDSNRIARAVYEVDVERETHVSDATGAVDPVDLHGTTTTGVVDGSKRVYDCYVSDLTDETGVEAGFALVLRDVSDRDAYERRLEVSNRVLRHNLRNDMNVVLGHAEMLAESADTDEQARLAEVIRSTAADLVSLSEKTRTLAAIQSAPSEGETVDVVPVVASLVEAFRAENPDVSVSVDSPAEASAVVLSTRALTTAVENLLENAVEHNDDASLAVDVTVLTDGETTRIVVSDDGSGLPEVEREVLEDHSETPLRHSSGLGLWLTHWVVSATGGEMSVDETESEGTTIALSFPCRLREDAPAGPAAARDGTA